MKESIIKDFYNITMNGRLCYIFMCIERYLTQLYPERDWAPISKRMWQWTTHLWDESSDIYSEAVPEYILEFEGYEKTNELVYDGNLKIEDYDEITALFKDITNGDGDDEFCHVLKIPIDFGCICEGTSFKCAEPLVVELIVEIENILKKHDIRYPDKALLKSFENERDKPIECYEKEPGWGDFENTEYLSIILN
ncbi:hypothetical protein [Ruminococcus albus]|uniref:Uncharacterized protein n=1 Tax=Ruminococcus albus TaxID=1264 RepID=A0A1H7P309_RUMAL|nr:hypothetical protein [Ruminococcus albus]SEL29834.1 hypothetical protein SAMN05216469_11842 [Ruminococcus albus]